MINRTTITRIPASPEMQRFNRAVEACDALTGYRFDRAEPWALAHCLRVETHWAERWSVASELELAAMDLERATVEVPAACVLAPEDLRDAPKP